MHDRNLEIGFVVFPNVTQLDLTGPSEVLSRMAEANCQLVWKTKKPVQADKGFVFSPDVSFEDVDPCRHHLRPW